VASCRCLETSLLGELQVLGAPKTWYIFEAWEKGLPETRRVCTPKMEGIGFAKGNFIISFFLFNHPFSGANC